ncbi:MAG: hypothetical protein ABEK01_05160 [Candidatus Nanohaloarchaea archaeon]
MVFEPTAYVRKSEEDMEKVAEDLKIPEDGEEAEMVSQLHEEINNLVRRRVGTTNHYRAIRSLNDPGRHGFVDEEKGVDGQLAGEEFFGLSDHMKELGDVEELRFWMVAEGQRWTEETRNDRGEHLREKDPVRGLEAYSVTLNGRELSPEEVKTLSDSFFARRQGGSEEFTNRIPGYQERYGSVSEVLEEESITEEEFIEELQEAHEMGLVDEKGEQTLLGYLNTLELEARDRKEMVSSARKILDGEKKGVSDLLKETDSYRVNVAVDSDLDLRERDVELRPDGIEGDSGVKEFLEQKTFLGEDDAWRKTEKMNGTRHEEAVLDMSESGVLEELFGKERTLVDRILRRDRELGLGGHILAGSARLREAEVRETEVGLWGELVEHDGMDVDISEEEIVLSDGDNSYSAEPLVEEAEYSEGELYMKAEADMGDKGGVLVEMECRPEEISVPLRFSASPEERFIPGHMEDFAAILDPSTRTEKAYRDVTRPTGFRYDTFDPQDEILSVK